MLTDRIAVGAAELVVRAAELAVGAADVVVGAAEVVEDEIVSGCAEEIVSGDDTILLEEDVVEQR
eukprot:7156478-Heterocapsa_arctica.AAC.1